MSSESLAVFIVVVVAGIALIRWFLTPTPLPPDPWGPEVEQTLHDPDLPLLCHRCLTPQPTEGWFCPECGASVGPYNNYMPFINAFSQGEVFRAGVRDHIRSSVLTIGGYLLYSLTSYLIFAPLYCYFLFQNVRRHDAKVANGPGKQT